MRRALVWVVFVLLAGCSTGPPEEPNARGIEGRREPAEPGIPNATTEVRDQFYLRDPDVLGLRASGLRVLNLTNNATTRLSNALLAGPSNSVEWILLVPTAALSNRTASCAPAEASWRIKHYPSGIDTLTNTPMAAGNWSLLVHAPRLSNLTLLFNTTSLLPYRTQNGTPLVWRSEVLDADLRIESDNSPYRVTFNKTFQTTKNFNSVL